MEPLRVRSLGSEDGRGVFVPAGGGVGWGRLVSRGRTLVACDGGRGEGGQVVGREVGSWKLEGGVCLLSYPFSAFGV